MLKKSLLFSAAIHAVLVAIIAYWVLRIPESIKPKPIPVTIVALPPFQKTEPIHTKSKPIEPVKKEIPKPQELIVQKPIVTPIAKSQPVETPTPVAVSVPKPIEKEAPQAVAPKVPPSPPKPSPSEISQVKNQYLGYIRQSIDEHKSYPKNAKRLGQTGTVEITFTIMADGSITRVSVNQTSGFPLLDKAATDILIALVKVRPIPKELGKESWEITLPIEYSIH